MAVSKNSEINLDIVLNGMPIVHCRQYRYLGSTVNSKWDISQEICSRIELACNVFIKMQKLLKCQNLRLNLHLRMVK